MFYESASDPYDPIDNPEGYLVMLVAENKLMWKEMAQKLEEAQASNPLPEWIFNYGDFGGDLNFKKSMRDMMQHWIHAPIDTDYLRFQAGAGSVLSQLSYLLADSGDGVLHSGPGYPAFVGDFGVYGHTTIHVAETKESNNFEPTIQDLDQVYERSLTAGNPPKILIICQPNNPTGRIYSKESMEEMIRWALEKDLHVISDEIYALSAFPGYKTVSAADVMRTWYPENETYLGEQVHVVAGLSKDWGMSGFRVGSLLTHNQDLLKGFDTIDYYQGVSSYTQFMLTAVFEDRDFVRWYIDENQRRLYETYQELKSALQRIDVPLYESQGTIFAWADFSLYLKDGQTEEELWMELFRDVKVALTTGESCYGGKPGLFRVVYAWPEGGATAMKELGRRLEGWAKNRKQVDSY